MPGPAASCRCLEKCTSLHILQMISGVFSPEGEGGGQGRERALPYGAPLSPWDPRTNSSDSSDPPAPPSPVAPPLILLQQWPRQSPWHLARDGCIILQSFSFSSSQSPTSAYITSWIPPKTSVIEIADKGQFSIYKELLHINKKKAETPKGKTGSSQKVISNWSINAKMLDIMTHWGHEN